MEVEILPFFFKLNLEMSFAHITFAYQIKTTTKMQDLINMPTEQKKALRNIFLIFIVVLLIESFLK
jgi:hypothetical protein